MEQERRTDQLITKYFFGELSDDEQRQLEERYFVDSEFLERMQAVEAELIEDYLAGALSKEAAAKLEAHMLQSPHQQRKLTFTESFLRVAAKQTDAIGLAAETKRKSWSFPLILHRYIFTPATGAVAALAITLSFAAWVIFDISRLRRELGELQKEQAVARAREQELQAAIAQLKGSKQTNGNTPGAQIDSQQSNSTDEINAREHRPSQLPPRASDELNVATLVLSPSVFRSGQELPKQVEILKNTRTLQLQLLYEGADASNYQAVVETADGDELLLKTNLKAKRSGNKQTVILDIPSALLTNRTYVLTLRTSSGVDLSRYTFAVTKK
ncbi:MAG TPA: zf-HC2 domain-containing protein [Pyrinomonadaceae bacterium]|nr:zf-HC2 domain-containing protein [Pyrinomonadaceae bacterium]